MSNAMQPEASSAQAHRESQVESIGFGANSAGGTGDEEANDATADFAAAAHAEEDVDTLFIGGRRQATTAQWANPPELKRDSCPLMFNVTIDVIVWAAAATRSNEGESRRGGSTR
jgi:hypothetical protein